MMMHKGLLQAARAIKELQLQELWKRDMLYREWRYGSGKRDIDQASGHAS